MIRAEKYNLAKKRKNREVFAAFDERGNLLTATIRQTKKEAEDILRKFNPPVDGFSYPYKILPVTLRPDQLIQHKFNFDSED